MKNTRALSVTVQFKKDCKQAFQNGLDPALLKAVITYLVKHGQPLPPICKDAPLAYVGDYRSALITTGERLIYLLTDSDLQFIRIVGVSNE